MNERADPFALGLGRLLLTFFTVVLIDVVGLSLFTHQLRFWFPVWLDPEWASKPHGWVVYSQSYFAGIFLIPVLAVLVERHVLPAGAKLPFRAIWIGAFAFILWWKGSLMVQHGKGWEAAAWLALTAMIWTLVGVAASLPERLARLSRRDLLRGLVTGVAAFFLCMAVIDPVVQLAVQRLEVSSGLLIEVGFFVPAGIALMLVARRLRAA